MSTPVTWDQLTDVAPDDFDVFTVPDWLSAHGDPLVGLDEQVFGLEQALEWWIRGRR